MSKVFQRILEKSPKDSKIFIKMSLDMVEAIYERLDELGITQRELAQRLGKSESEISKWLTGTHNFTFKTIAKLDVALETNLLLVNCKRNLRRTKFAPIQNRPKVRNP